MESGNLGKFNQSEKEISDYVYCQNTIIRFASMAWVHGIFQMIHDSTFQVLAFFLRPNKDTKIRKYWNWYHNWFGRLALFFGAVNIVLGIQVGAAGNEWKIGYGFLVGTIMASVLVLEALLWMRNSTSTNSPSGFQMNPVDQAPPSTFVKGLSQTIQFSKGSLIN